MRIGLVGVDSSHAEDFLRHFNTEARHHDIAVTALWGGGDRRTAELLASAPVINAMDSLDDLIANVDAVIIGDRHGDLHLPHALLLHRGRQARVHRQALACNLGDAERIVDAAAQAGLPLVSASAPALAGRHRDAEGAAGLCRWTDLA